MTPHHAAPPPPPPPALPIDPFEEEARAIVDGWLAVPIAPGREPLDELVQHIAVGLRAARGGSESLG